MGAGIGRRPTTRTAAYRVTRDAAPANARALLETSPVTLIFGGWDSNRRSRQARWRSALVGEIVGFVPASRDETGVPKKPELGVDGLTLSDVDNLAGRRSDFHDRFQTWTWYDPGAHVPIFKVTRNAYRSHNTTCEEPPLLWDFLKYYSREVPAMMDPP